MRSSEGSHRIAVVLVDDQVLVREGVRALLERADDITVVGEAASGADGVRVVKDLLPDVVLMDIRMPDMDGIAATQAIVADPALRSVRVLVLTTFDTDRHIIDAVRAGAVGFLLKNTGPDEMRQAVRVVAAGDALLSPSVTRRVMAAAAGSPGSLSQDRLSDLTEREREVLIEVGAGRNNEEIGRRLFMSPATARTHIGRLLTKLGARDRSQLVIIAYETGLIRPGDTGPASALTDRDGDFLEFSVQLVVLLSTSLAAQRDRTRVLDVHRGVGTGGELFSVHNEGQLVAASAAFELDQPLVGDRLVGFHDEVDEFAVAFPGDAAAWLAVVDLQLPLAVGIIEIAFLDYV